MEKEGLLDSGTHTGLCGRWVGLSVIGHDSCLGSWEERWGLKRDVFYSG